MLEPPSPSTVIGRNEPAVTRRLSPSTKFFRASGSMVTDLTAFPMNSSPISPKNPLNPPLRSIFIRGAFIDAPHCPNGTFFNSSFAPSFFATAPGTPRTFSTKSPVLSDQVSMSESIAPVRMASVMSVSLPFSSKDMILSAMFAYV